MELEYNHNHPVNALQTLTFKDISINTRDQIKTMYQNGFTPRLAFKEMYKEVTKQASDEIQVHLKIADRSIMPLRSDFNSLYTEFKREKFGTKDLQTMFSLLNEKVEKLRESDGYRIKFQPFNEVENDPFILTIVSPLMLRVHEMVNNSGELIFIDSSSNMDEFNLRVFVIVTHSNAGSLPLGLVITSDETTSTLTQAFEMFKNSLPINAFSGKGVPHIIMTDNCKELRDALRKVWPMCILLLCIFHMLQQVWKWLFLTKNGIRNSERAEIILMFKKIIYENEVEGANEAFEEMISSDLICNYPNLVKYLTALFERKEEWALCYRTHLMIRGNNTNNPVEAQFLVLKDDVLNRTKEINVIGLLDKLTTEFNDHYKLKLLSIASGRFDGCFSRRFKGICKTSDGHGFNLPLIQEQEHIVAQVTTLGHNSFRVPSFTSDNVFYTVDMNIGLCECKTGQTGDVCKHQYILWAFKLTDISNFLPYFNPLEKQKYAKIAIGETMPIEFYEGIHDRLMGNTVLLNNEPCPSSQYHENTPVRPSKSKVTGGDRRRFIEILTPTECKDEIRQTLAVLEGHVEKNGDNLNFLRGVMKFCERAQKYPISRLENGLHNFGLNQSSSLKITAHASLKRARKGKIYVQPEAVKRRRVVNGSKKAILKGMNVKNNPFEVEVSKKRLHKFSLNVENNEAISKKAGRTMCSKTKHLTKCCTSKDIREKTEE